MRLVNTSFESLPGEANLEFIRKKTLMNENSRCFKGEQEILAKRWKKPTQPPSRLSRMIWSEYERKKLWKFRLESG